jgi:hypothetical protein
VTVGSALPPALAGAIELAQEGEQDASLAALRAALDGAPDRAALLEQARQVPALQPLVDRVGE